MKKVLIFIHNRLKKCTKHHRDDSEPEHTAQVDLSPADFPLTQVFAARTLHYSYGLDHLS